ncbi:MAG TPA: hypothetical protein VNS50_12920 [Ginsengibacter sp.]|nr:hypothetical protein [Ginsengibacter sp.]
MKKALITIIVLLIMQAGFCQAKDASQNLLDSMSQVVIHYFQNKQADSVYALAGQTFKSKITADNFKSISENQIFPLNNFQNVTYINTTNGINKYKVSGTPDLQLLIGLDKESKIETLLIQPFSDN